MELDEFKTYWNSIQDKEFKKQKLTKEKLDRIIMKTTETLDYLQKKSAYWAKINKFNTQTFKGMLIPISLIILVKVFLLAVKSNSIGAFLTYLGMSLTYLVIIGVFGLANKWAFKRQQQIFTFNDRGNLKETLTKTISDFKRFYVKFNIIYLLLYPLFYYAVIKLLVTYWTPSTNTVLLTCALLTVVTLAVTHLMYKVQFINKIKLLEANLKELEEGE